MEMTFRDYINNPMGRKNAVISNREMYRVYYTGKYNKLMVRENGKIDYSLYKHKDTYYIHLKIPSETVKEFYYDVVIMFYPKDKVTIAKSLEDYNVKFFSNDPSFTYTFAHAFVTNKVFIEDLKSKMSPLAIKKEAKEKNPKNEVGYVKTIYFAYLFMKSRGLFNKLQYTSATEYDQKQLLSQIMEADEKIKLRQEGEESQRKSKKPKSKTPVNRPNNNLEMRSQDLSVGKVNTVGKVGNIKKSSKIKGTKTTRRK